MYPGEFFKRLLLYSWNHVVPLKTKQLGVFAGTRMNTECEDEDRNKSLKSARGVQSVQLALPPLACLHLFERG